MNGDGYIDGSELKEFIVKVGYEPNDWELFNLMSEMDLEEKNRISFDNFLKVILGEKKKREE